MKPHSSFATLLITGAVWIGLIIGCSSGTQPSVSETNSPSSTNANAVATPTQSGQKPEEDIEQIAVINIPKLMFQRPAVIEKSLGKTMVRDTAMHSGKITGEYRYYYLKEAVSKPDGEVRIEFFQQKAVSFLLYVDTKGDCGKALRMVGIRHLNTRMCDRRRDENSFFERYVAETLKLSGVYEGVELVNSFISPEQYDTGPSGVYQILLQGKSPVT